MGGVGAEHGDFAHRERRGEIVTVGRGAEAGAEPAADNKNQNSVGNTMQRAREARHIVRDGEKL